MIGRLLHTFWLLFVGLLFLFAVTLTVARLWVPVLGEYRVAAEQALSELLEQPVSITRMEATWRGLNPVIKLKGVAITDDEQRNVMLGIDEVWVGIDTRAYLDERQIRPSSIDIIGANVTLIREADGNFHIDGIRGKSGDNSGLSRLLQMQRLAIHDSTVLVHDIELDHAAVRFSDVTLTLSNEDRQYSVIGYVMLPPELGYRVDVQAVLQGSGDWVGGWSGSAYLKGQSLAVTSSNLQRVSQEMDINGVADMRCWVDFEYGRLSSATAEIEIHALRIANVDNGDAILVDRVSGQFGWRKQASGWQLAAQDLVIAHGGYDRQGTEFTISSHGSAEDTLLTADFTDLYLQDLQVLAQLAPGVSSKYRQQLATLQPEGMVKNLAFNIEGPADQRRLTWFDASFRDVGINSVDRSPVIQRLRGSITGSPGAGALWLDSHHVSVQDDALFRDVLQFEDVEGEVAWHSSDDLLTIGSDNLRVANDDLELAAKLTVVMPTDTFSPVVDLDADFVRGKLGRIHHYLPARVMSAKGVRWLDRSLVSGDIRGGSVVLQGRLDQLPYDNGGGRLVIRLPVHNAILDYNEDWTRIERLEAEVNFTGRKMDVYSSNGYIRSAKLAKVHAQIRDLQHPDLTIKGTINGQLPVMLAEMNSSPVGDVYGAVVERVASEGPAGLDLDIFVPLHGNKNREITVAGAIHFKGNTLIVKGDDVSLEDIKGELTFTPDGFRGDGLSARMLETPVQADVWTDSKTGKTKIQLRGPLDVAALIAEAQPPLAKYIDGHSQWQVLLGIGRLQNRDQVPEVDLRLSSGLDGIAIDLPAPFGKPAQDTRQLVIDVNRLAWPDRQLHLRYADHADARLAIEQKATGMGLKRGHLAVGGATAVLPDKNVMHISGKLDKFHLTQWQPLLDDTRSGGGPPVELDVQLGELEVLRHIVRDVGVQAKEAGLVQDYNLSGKSAKGNIQLTRTAAGIEKVVANMEKLLLESMPAGEADTDAASGGTVTPADFPELHITIQKFKYNGIKLGNAQLQTLRKPDAVEIEQLVLASNMLELRASGNWHGKAGADRSWFDIEINAGQLDKLLEAFDYKEQIEGGELSGSISAGWNGAPWDFEPARVEGKLYLLIKDGQLVDVKPGAGRVFGLVSLHTLPRRLSLDFSDLFKKGFGFDRIEGNFVLDGGNAYTDDLQIEGPAARIDISGRIGLADEDYDQLVSVVPNVSSSLPLAGALAGGPAVGAALLLAEQLLNDRIDAVAVRQYSVTGPWSDPVYEKLEKKQPEKQTTEPDYDE
ncbi:MAG: YhdP family protein [Pseudomonadota bacterium]